LIDLIVMIEHLAREVAVAFAECVHCARQSLFRLAAKQQDSIT
jgi:hypothetical protein